MIRQFVAVTALVAVPLAGAIAQTQPQTGTTPPAATTDPSRTTTPPGTTPTPSRDPRDPSAQRAQGQQGAPVGSQSAISYIAQQNQDQMLASNLIGTTVRGSADENIGEINDILLDRQGKAVGVVIGVGGFLGIGEKDVAVPFETIQVMRDPNNERNMRFTVASTKEALKQAPEFQRMGSRAGSTATTGSDRGSGTGTTPTPRPATPQ